MLTASTDFLGQFVGPNVAASNKKENDTNRSIEKVENSSINTNTDKPQEQPDAKAQATEPNAEKAKEQPTVNPPTFKIGFEENTGRAFFEVVNNRGDTVTRIPNKIVEEFRENSEAEKDAKDKTINKVT